MEQTSTVVITVGRNIGTEPMTRKNWLYLLGFIQETIADVGGEPVFLPDVFDVNGKQVFDPHALYRGATQTGVGVWRGEITEEAAAFVALVPTDALPQLRNDLQYAAQAYNQEAIGFVVADGADNLIYANETAA